MPTVGSPLCFSQDIVTRHLAEKSAAEDQLPPLGPVVWTAGSQSELTPSESLATSDAVRDALLLPRWLSPVMSLCRSFLLLFSFSVKPYRHPFTALF